MSSPQNKNKTILISGGSDGLGKEIAKLLISNYHVVILAPSQEKTQKTADELGCDFVVADVSSSEQVKAAIEKIGSVDVLINNAGIWIEGPLETNQPEAIKKVLDVNTLGTIYLTHAVIPQMKDRRAGRIINVISQGGLNAKPNRSIYYASKWAITGFTKCLELELAEFGIAVTGVYPGKMKTKMYEKVGISKDFSDAADPAEVAKTIVSDALL